MLTLLLLTGCIRYDCGTLTMTDTVYGDVEGGEWCGLFGTFAFHYEDTDNVQVLVSPDARDADTDAFLIDLIPVVELTFPHDSLVDGTSLTLGDDLEVVCGFAPMGAGSGSLFLTAPASASLEVGPRSNRAQTGDFSQRLAWDVDCGPLQSSGDDRVDIDVEPVQL